MLCCCVWSCRWNKSFFYQDAGRGEGEGEGEEEAEEETDVVRTWVEGGYRGKCGKKEKRIGMK